MDLVKEYKRYLPKLQRKILLEKKKIYHSLLTPAEDKKILFIMGCQRSGTTMMQKIFEKDLHAKVYGEFSKLSRHDRGRIRLNPLNQVKREIDKDTPPLVVMKPLVETQNLKELLQYFPSSKVLWMFRHFKDVAASNLVNFGKSNGIDDLRPIAQRDPHNWRSEGATDHVTEVVQKYFSENMDEMDAAALFWYARNSLFFDLNLGVNPRVMMCRYEDLVREPAESMKEIYAFADAQYPGEQITDSVSTSSVGKGKHVELNPEIEVLCNQMLKRLEDAYFTQQKKKEVLSSLKGVK
ncbi:sulfotransferase family protein [Nafulsella turpanensis]|uniref:sulfotransferase family protein n=1 Tax=Nafulsella turpanensis TaxID=1265690 RepID=UPI00034A763E|nr:sulfotransferase [Nafulsella turpanensis]